MVKLFVGREKEYKHEWYLKNKARLLVKANLYYQQNTQAKKEYSKKYYHKNFDKIKPKKALYKKKHSDRNNELERLRRLLPKVREHNRNYNFKRKDIQRKYRKDYTNGRVVTPKILLLEKSLPLIKKLYYEQGWDAKSIADKLSCTKDVIVAVLRRNNLPVKQKQFSPRRYLPCSNGLLVRSNPERIIVEFLINNNVEFIYEQPLPYKDTIYYPDFYLPDRDLFVEFAGLTDKKWYVEQLEKKRKAYQDLQKNVSFITKPEQIVEVLA